MAGGDIYRIYQDGVRHAGYFRASTHYMVEAIAAAARDLNAEAVRWFVAEFPEIVYNRGWEYEIDSEMRFGRYDAVALILDLARPHLRRRFINLKDWEVIMYDGYGACKDKLLAYDRLY